MDNLCKFLEIIDQFRNNLIYMKYMGVDRVNCSEKGLTLLSKLTFKNSDKGKEKSEDLVDLFNKIKDCKRCKLNKYRNNVVFGEGNEDAKLVFLGEAPGFEEDISGRPFVGRAGKLLDRIIEAMGFDRDEVYICNLVKCRPPNNRNPENDEIESCIEFLRQQLNIISPKIICVLGAVASRGFLNLKVPISRIRGNCISVPSMDYVKAIPTYHPAYLLRNPSKKREVWEDIQKIIRIIK